MSNEIGIKSIYSFFIQVIGIILNYLFIYIVNKFYGSNSYGNFILMLSILNTFVILGKFGMDLTFVKITAENYNKKELLSYIYYKVIFYILCFDLLLIIIFLFLKNIIFNLFHNSYLENYYYLILIGFIPMVLKSINANVLRGLGKIVYFNLLQNVYIYSILIILIFAFKFILNFSNIFLLYIFAIIITVCISFYYLKKYLYLTKLKVREIAQIEYKIKNIFKISSYLFLTNSIMFIYGIADIMMLGIFTDNQEIAIYNVCYKIATFQIIIFMAIMSILAPKIAYFIKNKQIFNLKNNINKINIFLFVISLIFISIIYFFGKKILILFGNEYTNGYYILFVLSIAFFTKNILGSYEYVLSMGNKQSLLLKISFISMLINIILNYILIPKFYAFGASIATLISFILYNMLNYFFAKKYMELL